MTSTLISRCANLLRTAPLAEKCALSAEIESAWKSGGLPIGSPESVPDRPGRPVGCNEGLPQKSNATSFLASVAHAESWAIDLSWDIIGRFGGGDALPREFYDDWVRVAVEEVKHYSDWVAVLADRGYTFQGLDDNETLWDAARATAGSLEDRLALVHLVHEGRGLDTYPTGRRKLAGTPRYTAILDRNYEEEIGHVGAAAKWFKFLCERRGADPRVEFHRIVKRAWPHGLPNRPAFNTDARDRAGVPRAWYTPLVARESAPRSGWAQEARTDEQSSRFDMWLLRYGAAPEAVGERKGQPSTGQTGKAGKRPRGGPAPPRVKHALGTEWPYSGEGAAPARVLLLHGWGQNEDAVGKKAGSLIKRIRRAASVFAPRAPHKLPETSELSSDVAFGWFIYNAAQPSDVEGFADVTGPRYHGASEGLRVVKAAEAEHGPFTHVIGFSQGAVFAQWLLAARRSGEHGGSGILPALRGVVFLGGFPCRPTEFEQEGATTAFTLPSLHVIGTRDTRVEPARQRDLAECFEGQDKSVLELDLGHAFVSRAADTTAVLNFLQATPAE